MTLEPGTLLNDRYRIQAQLGSGGMGAVYRSHDENLDVEVAVKENFFVSEESARQFVREARILATLRHPSLPRVTDHFVIPEQGQYLVMDFVEGKDAREILEEVRAPLDEARVLTWAQEVMDAVIYLHSRTPPIIHRDIKPGNIKITPAGRAVLVDFGLAKKYNPGQSTTVGAKAFTPGFAPPEQYGQGRTDVRTDVYALGATLYNLLTARVPADSLRRAMGKERLTPIRELNQAISPHTASVIERAIEVKPEDRFADVRDFKASLEAAPTMLTPAAATVVRQPTPPEMVRPVAPQATPPGMARPAAPAIPRHDTPAPDIRPVRSGLPGWVIPVVIGAVLLVALGAGGGLLLTGALPIGGGGASPASPISPPTEAATLPLVAVEPSSTPAPTQAQAAVETSTPSDTATAEPSPTPAVTPQGGGLGQIAFVSERSGLPQIFVMNVDGSDQTQLTDIPDGACQPAWSPDGQQLLFISPCREKRSQYSNAAIYIMKADGSEVQVLISKPGGVYDPAWSQAGIAFTYLENNIPALWLADPDGTNQVKISLGRARDSQASWAPNADKLAVMNTSRAGSPTIFWVASDGSFPGSNPDQITRDQEAYAPAWSPLGDLVAYVAGTHIYIVPWDGRGFGAVKLTVASPNDDPDWSPDGRWIVFETWRDAANHDVYIMTDNGAQPTRLTTDPANDYHPAWRP